MVMYLPGGKREWSAYAKRNGISSFQSKNSKGLTTRHDRAEHDRLVGLVLEVGIPKLIELRSHLLQLLFRWTNLYEQKINITIIEVKFK